MDLLLVEDDELDARMVARALLSGRSEHVIAEQARTLAEATEALARRSFDAVLLDLGLPDSSGLDSISTILAVAPDAILIVLTGNDDDLKAAESLGLGAHDYLPKDAADGRTLQRALRYSFERRQINARLTKQRVDLENALTELRASREKQLQFERLQTTAALTHGIAHEFNNALAVIAGNIELLQRDDQSGSIDRGEALRRASAATAEASRVATALGAAFGEQRRSGELPAPPEETSLKHLIGALSGEESDLGVALGEAQQAEAQVPAETAGRYVLLVDDEEQIVTTYTKLLNMLGVPTVSFSSPLEALKVFDPKKHVAAIVDRSMPEMLGDDLAARLKEIRADLPIIMLTGFGSMMQQADEQVANVDVILSKPCTGASLLAVLKEHCVELFDTE